MGFLDRLSSKAVNYDDDYDFEEPVDETYTNDYNSDYDEPESDVASIHSVPGADVERIVTSWVSSFSDVRDFADEFREGLPVILNLSQASDNERARIVDFAVGLCFGLDGLFSRISDDVFLLTPHRVKVDAQGGEAAASYLR
ncbi:MAG: cell division protein SepF [Actinomycetaceae bacterium]|nr:cell division protein SepF [Arcanobacterium sp.]MDD7505427.1 cell division protein SepF [Actinomycetaceae bacterium]MDY6142764.1 cell division protein SepF [Arcanobacterium sp.]